MTPLFADVTIPTEVAIPLVVSVVGSLGGVIAMLYREVQRVKDAQIAALQAEKQLEKEKKDKKSYEEMFAEAMKIVRVEVVSKVGEGAIPPLAPVVPEHSSPVTKEEQEAANLVTARASLTAAQLALGLPARVPGPPETENQAQARVAKEKFPPRLSLESEPTSEQTIATMQRDIADVKEGQVRKDIAEVKKDVAEVKDVADETLDKLKEKGQDAES